MTTDKAVANWTIDALAQLGMRTLIFSPGSRNTPLIIAGTSRHEIQCHTVLDERSAAFQAMGSALITDEIVGVCCTSGSALANYYPAVLEAFYSKIPLVLITADRPVNRINKGEGQTCEQADFYGRHIGFSASFDENTTAGEFNEVIEHIHRCLKVKREPVHINLHFDEPLYGQVERFAPLELPLFSIPEVTKADSSDLNECEKVAIVCGQMRPRDAKNVKSSGILTSSNATWFVDPLSHLLGEDNCVNIDELVDHKFDGLLSFGGQWMSKSPKFHVRSLNLKAHVHCDPYQGWNVSDLKNFTWVKSSLADLDALPFVSFLKAGKKRLEIPVLPWSDALAIQTIISSLASEVVLHLGNSSIPRYMSYFRHNGPVYCNRGISGIDGSLSASIGAAQSSPEKNHVLIIGDQSFLYDSNALIQLSRINNLRVYVINNGVGEIFNWLPGTSEVSPAAKAVYANYQQVSVSALAVAYGCGSQVVKNVAQLQEASNTVIEVLTVGAKNTAAYKKLASSL